MKRELLLTIAVLFVFGCDSSELKDELGTVKNQLSEAEESIAETRAQLDKAGSEVKNLQSKASTAEENLGKEKTLREETQVALEKSQLDSENLKSQLTQATSKIESLQKVLGEANNNLKKAQGELDTLVPECNQCRAKLEELSQTDKAAYQEIQKLIDAGNAIEAVTNVIEMEKKFPESNLVPMAKDRVLDTILTAIRDHISVTDKASYTKALGLLDTLQEAGFDKKKIAPMRAELSETMSEWPIEMDSLDAIRLQFADLRGKKLIVSDVTFQADDYYNYVFKNEKRWRSFEIEKEGSRRLNGYCPRGEAQCEAWFKAALTQEVEARQMVITYPRKGRADDGQVQILMIQ